MAIDKINNKNMEILFSEWIAKNHYRLANETKDCCYWENEYGTKTTLELLIEFKSKMPNTGIIKDFKNPICFPDYKTITVDEYNWLVDCMEITRDYLETIKKDLPKKI